MIVMLSATVRSGRSDSSWNMQATPAATAALGEAKLGGLAVDEDLARVRPDDAREDLDQGGFAGAVFAEEGMDAAAVAGELHALEGTHAAIVLGDVLHAQKMRIAAVHCHSPLKQRSGHRQTFAGGPISAYSAVSCCHRSVPRFPRP